MSETAARHRYSLHELLAETPPGWEEFGWKPQNATITGTTYEKVDDESQSTLAVFPVFDNGWYYDRIMATVEPSPEPEDWPPPPGLAEFIENSQPWPSMHAAMSAIDDYLDEHNG